MFELLFVIIVGVIIYKRVQGTRQSNGTGNTPAGQAPTLPPISHSGAPGRTGAPVSRIPQNKKTPQNISQSSAIEEAKKDGNSTTAYLMEKAEADAKEHAREKYEEQKRLYETRGGLAVAGRHLDGDPIPQGSRCVKCGYCGAENLLPMVPRTRYSCYFCREPL